MYNPDLDADGLTRRTRRNLGQTLPETLPDAVPTPILSAVRARLPSNSGDHLAIFWRDEGNWTVLTTTHIAWTRHETTQIVPLSIVSADYRLSDEAGEPAAKSELNCVYFGNAVEPVWTPSARYLFMFLNVLGGVMRKNSDRT